MTEKRLDALIQAGWEVLERNYDQAAFLSWRKQAYDCVSLLVGPDHPYAECMRLNIQEVEPSAVLADVGILTAAKLSQFQGFTSYIASQSEELEQHNPVGEFSPSALHHRQIRPAKHRDAAGHCTL